MSSLPEPQTLTPTAARALIRTIRGQWRPQLLETLGGLYGSQDDSVLSRAQIMAEELRLQKLDQYLLGLIPIVARGAGPLGWESFRPAMTAVRRPTPAEVEAEVELPFTPENNECVHGPLTLLAIVGQARRLLAAGERVTGVERVTWALPLRHRLRLSLWDAATPAAAAASDSALHGRLRTSLGRLIAFNGTALDQHPLLLQRDYNSLSRALVSGRRMDVGDGGESVTLELAEAGLAACRSAVRRRPALVAALVLDLVPLAILNWKRGRPMLACGYRDVPLPASPAAAFAPGTRLELRYRAGRSHASARSGLWIGHYEFRYLPRDAGWSTMVMAEADDLAVLLRKLHA